MWLTYTSIKRPIFLMMFVAALIVVGLISRSKMPQEQMPRIDFPYVTVVTSYPGAGPNEMETLVTEPLEKAVSSIGHLKNVTSSSQDGVSVVGMEFELGTDLNAAAADVRDKVSAAKQGLPKDINEPSIVKVDISSQPVVRIGLEGPLSPKDMRILADDVISDQLAKVGGVASVSVQGGEQREISVAIDRDRLQAYGFGINAVANALANANVNVPAGAIKQGARDFSVRTVGEFTSADEIGNVTLFKDGDDIIPIRLRDIATIKDTVKERDSLTRMNGKPTVTISIQKQSDANTVDVADGVKAALVEMKSKMPPGVNAIVADDQSVFVKSALEDVNKSLLEGIILVVIIVFLFLHTARATFIVAVAIPTSLFATYGPIYSLGFTLNFMTLLALSLCVGILVDDSIVIIENIERHIRLRENPVAAAVNGRTEIGFAAVAITLVDIVVFVPIAFMGGIVGQFFKQFGLTVAIATMFSLIMSFTLTPMLASRWMKSQEDKEREAADLKAKQAAGKRLGLVDSVNTWAGYLFKNAEKLFDAVDSVYERVLAWALDCRFLVIVIGSVSLFMVISMAVPLNKQGMMMRMVVVAVSVLLLLVSMAINKKGRTAAIVFGIMVAIICLGIYLPLGVEFQPNIDEGRFAVSLRTAPGTSLEATDKVVRQVEAVLDQIPELEGSYYFTNVGATGSGFLGAGDSGPQYASIAGKIVDKTERKPVEVDGKMRKRSIDDVVDWISRKIAGIPGAEQIAVTAAEGGGPGGGIQMEVQGANLQDIIATADRTAETIKSVPGTIDVDVSYKEGRPEQRIEVDRVKAAELGMSVAEIAMAARTAIDGNDTAKLREGGTEYPINVRYAKDYRQNPSDLGNIIISQKDKSPIYLRDVADVKPAFAPTKIDRKNRQRIIYVSANLAKGALLGNVQQVIEQKLKTMPKPPGIAIKAGGLGDIMKTSFGYMLTALLLAVLFVYMLMAGLFESMLTPFVIMFSLPQAMIGAILFLLVFGQSISIISLIGIIMLMGLVAKNAILLVDYTNTLRSRGKSRREAILEAGPTRLRPILMTTTAMIGGMLPTALATSRGAEIRQPMALAVMGGLIFSLLLTLIVIPVVYTIVDDIWQKLLNRLFPKYQHYKDLRKQRIDDVAGHTPTHPTDSL